MSLKQSIVVVNEFSVPTPGGGKHGGSRGGTPGAYVMRYMARKGATEPVTPIRRRDTEDFILRYMAALHSAMASRRCPMKACAVPVLTFSVCSTRGTQ